MKNIILGILAIITLLTGCSAIVTTQPTNSEIMIVPVSPGEGFIYINDSWDWNPGAHSYQPTPARWVAPKKSAVWVNGAWKKKRGGWKYDKGYWRSN